MTSRGRTEQITIKSHERRQEETKEDKNGFLFLVGTFIGPGWNTHPNGQPSLFLVDRNSIFVWCDIDTGTI
jgi:hypothetical protein